MSRFYENRASAVRDFDAQMASWTELRHDTIPYVKQSYSCVPMCDYPAGYVDPRVEFWDRLIDLCTTLQDALAALTYPEQTESEEESGWAPDYGKYSVSTYGRFLKSFKSVVRQLRGIAEKENAQEEMSAAQLTFLKKAVTRESVRAGSGSTVRFDGWFPKLFFEDEWSDPDPIVSDFHTIPPNDDGPGAVLHVATGYCPLMIVAAENGDNRRIYAGPVFERYEFQRSFGTRLTDEEWKAYSRKSKRTYQNLRAQKIYQSSGELRTSRY
eukprot:TRINITY_DN5413_c0_g1_i2.p1 TRINITY_DN5413_c0_g1~~TRINITY_DN5413_c0_g1_i2.p1  ORF type:complete len:269 (-),score=29.50 TRINITY_DN5413_c0_g1_i2:150-956(-)